MTLTLRPYQNDLIGAARVALRSNKSVLIQLPTGGGKTALATKITKTIADKNRCAFFICHRVELIDQTMATFTDFGIPYGVIAAGYPVSPYQPIQICSIDTLRARIRAGRPLPKPNLCIWDEAHHSAAASWAAAKAHFSEAHHIGLTATPERLDGKGLREHFSAMVSGPSVAELMAEGYLCEYRAFAPPAPDLASVHSLAGDFKRDENAEAMDKPKITGDAIGHYLKHARGKRAIVFAVSVKHSEHVAQQFRDAGVVAWHLDGGTKRGERQQAIAAFRRGEIKVLCNVELFGEGFDVPAADAAILLRPTKSLALHLQQCGRVLRPNEGKSHALILDHAGNIGRHGLPDDDRSWSLDGRDRKKKTAGEIGVKQCPSCYHAHRPAPVCPQCGFVYETQSRSVEQVEGELSELDIKAQRRAKAYEQNKAGTIEELIELGKSRGYKSPERWAGYVWTARRAGREERA